MDLLHTIREQWHEELENTSLLACYPVKTARLLRIPLPAVNAPIPCSTPWRRQSLQPIRTRRLIRTRKVQIRGVWSSIRLRNQYRPASACSRNRPFHHTNLQVSPAPIQQGPHSRGLRIYSALALLLLLSHLPLHAYRICSGIPAPSMASHAPTPQPMDPFAMPTDQEEWDSRFGTKLGGEEGIVLRACLRISRLRPYLISGSPHRD